MPREGTGEEKERWMERHGEGWGLEGSERIGRKEGEGKEGGEGEKMLSGVSVRVTHDDVTSEL